jgi:integrase
MVKRLTASTIRALRPGQRKGDGDGLAIENRNGVRLCIFRYPNGTGRYREKHLGRWRDERDPTSEGITLAEARTKVAALRGQLNRGIDPKADKTKPPSIPHTVRAVLELVIAKDGPAWKHDGEHASQWRQSLNDHANPIMDLDVNAITLDHIMDVLEPIWVSMTPTASRIRGRLERTLSYAITRGWRSGPNVAVWRGNLQNLLGAPAKLHQSEGHSAIDWREAPAFAAKLRATHGIVAQMLDMALHCGVRTTPVLEMRWGQIDLDAAIWTIPAIYEKTSILHRVPMCDHVMDILRNVRPDYAQPDDVVFHSHRGRGVARGHNALLRLMRTLDPRATVHGGRITFRSWVKANGFSRELAEDALSHVYEGRVERAYTVDGDPIELRRALMQAWADYLRGAQMISFVRAA